MRTRRRTTAMSDRTMEFLPLPRCCPTPPRSTARNAAPEYVFPSGPRRFASADIPKNGRGEVFHLVDHLRQWPSRVEDEGLGARRAVRCYRLEALVTSPERKAPVVAQADGKAVALAQRPLRHGLRLAPGARAAVIEMDRPRDRRRVSTEFLGER